MDNVIPFRFPKNRILSPDHRQDLSTLLREAVTISNNPRYANHDGLITIDGRGVEEFFFGKICAELRKSRRVSLPYIACARYVASCCAHLIDHQPPYWTAFEYLAQAEKTQVPEYFRLGGDACFLLTALFPGHTEHRSVNIRYYAAMGSGLYWAWYHQTDAVLGSHMASHFREIASALNTAYKTLR